MGIFGRKTPPSGERESFRDAMARAGAKNAERKERAEASLATTVRQNELVRAATDPATTTDGRDAATAELVELIGQDKANRLIGARSRLVRRGWIR